MLVLEVEVGLLIWCRLRLELVVESLVWGRIVCWVGFSWLTCYYCWARLEEDLFLGIMFCCCYTFLEMGDLV